MNQRRPRLHDPGYLTWIRLRSCIACGRFGPCDAAHIRSAALEYDKPSTGMGEKPDDRWALPLCRSCHLTQHAYGNELGYWKKIGRNPFQEAARLYSEYGGDGGYAKRKRQIIKPRLPKDRRQKIKSRGFR